MSLKERARQLYRAKCGLIDMYNYRESATLIDLVSLANVSLELYMKDKSAVELYFIGIWGEYQHHPQASIRSELHSPSAFWRYDIRQFLYANNSHRAPMGEARKIYHTCL